MTSHTKLVAATYAFHFIVASTLEIKRFTRNALSTERHADDNTKNDICSTCEADWKASWGVKCTYATSCGICAPCKADNSEDELIENFGEKPELDDKAAAAAPREEDSHAEDETNKELCSACEADSKAAWDVKCTYATSCGLCARCKADELEDDQIENFGENFETDDKEAAAGAREEDSHADQTAATLPTHVLEEASQCQGGDGKMYDHGAMSTCKWQCVNGEWKDMGACDETEVQGIETPEKEEEEEQQSSVRCQGGDGESYGNGATECKKGKAWYCANGEWKRKGECDEVKDEIAEVSKKEDNILNSEKDKEGKDITDVAPEKASTRVEETLEEVKAPVLGKGIAEGCSRGHDCGYTSGVVHEAVRVPCPRGGEKWMSPNAVVIRGRKGRSAIYCSVPKIGTSYTYGVMEDLNLPVKKRKRNSGYETVGDIVHENVTSKVEELCRAYSFIIIRNPWDRVVSAYVDKVLTREVFKEPPSFNHFMQQLDKIKYPETINQHFRPVSELCHTSGQNAVAYDEKIKIEEDLRHHLEMVFITKLKLPPSDVHKVMDEWETQKHPTTSGGRWGDIDFSLNSEQSRVEYYFSQSDRDLARRVYHDDIKFGAYRYEPK